MRQRRQITTCAEASLFRYYRMYSSIQTFKDEFERFQPDPGKPTGKRVRSNKHDRTHGRGIEGISHAHCMADDYVSLKLFNLREANDLILKCTETGGYPVGDLAAFKQRVDGICCTLNIDFRLFGQQNPRLAGIPVRYKKHLLKCEAFAVKNDLFHL